MMLEKRLVDPNKLNVGDYVQYENKYYAAAVVEITKDLKDENWFGYKCKVCDVIFGDLSEGEEFEFGYDPRYKHYAGIKLKKVGSMTDYVNDAGKIKELQLVLDKLNKKYNND